MKYRIGQGYDVHQLNENKSFRLGGVEIPHTLGAVGHSDADVIIHAICDALLGASNLGDIGYHFSDSLEKYKGIDSSILLRRTLELVRNEGYEIGNIDATLVLQTPKIAPFIPSIRLNLAKIMMIRERDISIKATTTESLGFIGRQEGVAAYAVAIIYDLEQKKDFFPLNLSS